ncbi:MAG TPA: AraC family transcriptional regulator [Chitinivibrionales bacterium]
MSINRIRAYFFAALPILCIIAHPGYGALPDSNCLNFVCPAHGAILKSVGCTLSVLACPKIESMHLSARYYPLNAATDTILDLGTITQPPFKLIWNIAEIPNQLVRGMGFIADGTFRNGKHTVLRLEGVFIYTKPLAQPPSLVLSPSAIRSTILWLDTIATANASSLLRLSGSGAARMLKLNLSVTDHFLSTAALKDKQKTVGVEIMLDAQGRREPFPSDKLCIIAVYVGKKVSQLHFKKFDDGTVPLSFSVDTSEYKYPSSIKMVDNKGFVADIAIPATCLGGAVPDSMGINVAVKLMDRDGKATVVTLNGASGADAYCPLLWAELRRSPPGILDNTMFVVSVSFALGLLVTLGIAFPLLLKGGRAITVNVSDLSEEEKRDVQTIFRFLEQNITQKDISPQTVGKQLEVSGSKIEATIKKFSGQPFKHYVSKSRVEIAKERLRCSHSSEKSIAESCGFKTIDEMEKLFQKYYRTTPYKYRRDNQVA